MPKFICIDPDGHRANRAIEVEAQNRIEARKAMCKGCVPVCTGPDKAQDLLPGQMSLFEAEGNGYDR